MKLVPDWRRALRWHSTWLAAILAAIPPAWMAMPPDLKTQVPEAWLPVISLAMFVAFMIGRVRAQE